MTDPLAPLRILIVGGGTAGWLTAAFLSRQLPLTTGRAVHVTLLEASDIPTIGVGEATIPSLGRTLAACGVGEAEFLKACDATFKHGIEFRQWRRPPHLDPGEAYFHPFGAPLTVGALSPARQWSRLDVAARGAFADLFSVQPELARAGRAPKHLRDAPYQGALAYAFHLDAGKLAEFLKGRFRAQGVRHLIGRVASVSPRSRDCRHAEQPRAGGIDTITLEDGRTLSADLFIDCTGFAARLINADGENRFVSKANQLFVDRAVTTRIPHGRGADILGYTRSTAQGSGWIWDIALQERRGVGHVYSSRHTSDETAHADLARYLGADPADLETRRLEMKIGYHAAQWRGNCVAIGLSSGFLEPLESTGIYLIEMANWALADLIPRHLAGAPAAVRYNEIMANHYETIVDFLKLHYAISARRDTLFWVENTDRSSWPASLVDKLETWADDLPSIYDFDRTTQCFSATNYLFVLFGMEWPGHRSPSAPTPDGQRLMAELAARRARLRELVLRDTVSNDELFAALGRA